MEVAKKNGSGIPVNARNRTRTEKQKKSKTNTPGPVETPRTKKHNCLNLKFATPSRTPSGHSIKSQSMVELFATPKPPVQTKHKSKELGDASVASSGAGDIAEIDMDASFALDEADADRAKTAYRKFVLNAWRKRRREVVTLGESVGKLKNQVANQNVQIKVLRGMFEAEKVRVAVAMGDSAHHKDRVERELKAKDHLNSEIASLENEKTQWGNERDDLVRKISFLESALKVGQEKISSLENDSIGYQDDISNLKATETDLSNKIGRIEMQLEDKNLLIKDMREKSASLQGQVKQLLLKNKSLEDAVKEKQKELAESNNRNEKLRKEVNDLKSTEKIQGENIKNLTRDFENATKKLESQNKIIEHLKNDLLQYQQEKQEFKDAMKSLRNQIIFGAIKTSAKLFLPVPLNLRYC